MLQYDPTLTIDVSDTLNATNYMKKHTLIDQMARVKASEEYKNMMKYLKYHIGIYGLTLKDEFEDYDRAKSNYITNSQFERILKTHSLNISEMEFNLLKEVFDDRMDSED